MRQTTLQPSTAPAEPATRRTPQWHVILWNDDTHSYAYVIVMLAKLFGYAPERGYQLAKRVDTQGRAVVWTGPREHAELKRDQIRGYGPDLMIRASRSGMRADIEAAA